MSKIPLPRLTSMKASRGSTSSSSSSCSCFGFCSEPAPANLLGSSSSEPSSSRFHFFLAGSCRFSVDGDGGEVAGYYWWYLWNQFISICPQSTTIDSHNLSTIVSHPSTVPELKNTRQYAAPRCTACSAPPLQDRYRRRRCSGPSG